MSELSEIKKRSIAGVIGYGVRSFALQGIAFVASLLLAYYLTPEDFGVFFVVSSVIGLFTFLSDVGLAAALVQKKEKPTLEELRTTFTVQQLLAFLIAGVLVFLTPVWRESYGFTEQGLHLLYALAGSFILASLKTIPSILLERELEFNKLVFPQIIEQIVFYGITVSLAAQGYGVSSYTYAVWTRGIFGVILMYIIRPWPIGIWFSLDAFQGLLKYGVKFQLFDLFARIKDDLLIVVIGRFLPAAEMGYVSWAKRWSVIPYQLSVQSVMSITFPTFARLQHEKAVLKRAIEKTMYIVSLFIFPLLMGMVIVAEPLLEIIPRYEKWLPALLSLGFFSLNIAWAAVSTPLINTLNAIGKINESMKLMIIWTSLTWILTPISIFFIGFHGVALAAFLVSCSSFLTVRAVQKEIPVQVWIQVRTALFSTMLMGVLVYGWFWFFPTRLSVVIGGIILGALSYPVMVWFIDRDKLTKEFRSLRSR